MVDIDIPYKTRVAFSREFTVTDGVTPIVRGRKDVLSLSGKVVGKHSCNCRHWVVVQLDRESREEALRTAAYQFKCLVVPIEEVILWKRKSERAVAIKAAVKKGKSCK